MNKHIVKHMLKCGDSIKTKVSKKIPSKSGLIHKHIVKHQSFRFPRTGHLAWQRRGLPDVPAPPQCCRRLSFERDKLNWLKIADNPLIAATKTVGKIDFFSKK